MHIENFVVSVVFDDFGENEIKQESIERYHNIWKARLIRALSFNYD